jgi:predicted Zn-dependent protease
MGKLVAIAVLLVLGACAPGRHIPAGQIAYDTQENYQRLQRVLQPIAVANAVLCEETVGVMMIQGDTEVCALSVGVSKSGALNAWTDGTNIMITRPMLGLLQSDDELAFILSHELAHILERHVQKASAASLAGAFLDVFASSKGVNTNGTFRTVGALIGSKDREREADKVGAYLMARAGFDPRAGAWLWERMPPGQDGWLASHPLSSERTANLLTVAAEIRAKRARSEILKP